MTSINDLGSRYYSDGYISFFEIVTSQKCSECHYIILNCINLEKLEEIAYKQSINLKPFGKKFGVSLQILPENQQIHIRIYSI